MTAPEACGKLQEVLAQAGQHARTRAITTVSEKAALDYVTNVDREMDAWLTTALREVAEAMVLSEERPFAGAGSSARQWLIDPVDGTHNLAAGIGFCGIGAALFENGAVVLAGVADIFADDVYVAERGAGAWLNGTRLQLPPAHSGLAAVSTGAIDAWSNIRAPMRVCGPSCGCATSARRVLHLCYVARGRIALAASHEARLWDVAPGRLIAEEAGARYAEFGRAALSELGLNRRRQKAFAGIRPNLRYGGGPVRRDMEDRNVSEDGEQQWKRSSP